MLLTLITCLLSRIGKVTCFVVPMTGEGDSKRELYTDDEDIEAEFETLRPDLLGYIFDVLVVERY